MFKKIFLCFTLFFLPSFVNGNTNCVSCHNPFSVKFRTAYFIPSSSRVRDVYTDGWPDYQFEVAYEFCNCWEAWGNFSWYRKDGNSSGCPDLKNKTRLRVYPFALGGNVLFSCSPQLTAYTGAGISYTILRLTEDSDYLEKNIHDERAGFLAKSGLRLSKNCCTPNGYYPNYLFFDLFVDYFYQCFRFSDTEKGQRHDLNVSGFKIGLGIGTSF